MTENPSWLTPSIRANNAFASLRARLNFKKSDTRQRKHTGTSSQPSVINHDVAGSRRAAKTFRWLAITSESMNPRISRTTIGCGEASSSLQRGSNTLEEARRLKNACHGHWKSTQGQSRRSADRDTQLTSTHHSSLLSASTAPTPNLTTCIEGGVQRAWAGCSDCTKEIAQREEIALSSIRSSHIVPQRSQNSADELSEAAFER